MEHYTSVTVRPAQDQVDLDHARRLVGLFIAWLKQLYPTDHAGVDSYFAAIQPELAALPGEYSPPDGRLLLAEVGGNVVGMVAMRSLGAGTCEMKRMFVDTALHGMGVGRSLAEALIVEARRAGYDRMRLDTSHGQVAAIRLYRSLGFQEIEPYYDAPPEVRDSLTFMELPLR
jgi:ribosomal protein S18 acetylase RimI-like enzyme